MTDFKRCDRCRYEGPAKDFDNLDVMAYTRDPENADSATYFERGKKAPITPAPVDLCQNCRADLRDFFRNVRVDPRHR